MRYSYNLYFIAYTQYIFNKIKREGRDTDGTG